MKIKFWDTNRLKLHNYNSGTLKVYIVKLVFLLLKRYASLAFL